MVSAVINRHKLKLQLDTPEDKCTFTKSDKEMLFLYTATHSYTFLYTVQLQSKKYFMFLISY